MTKLIKSYTNVPKENLAFLLEDLETELKSQTHEILVKFNDGEFIVTAVIYYL